MIYRQVLPILVVASALPAALAEWPQFRGVGTDGKATSSGFAQYWSANDGIAWAAPLPQPGNGSPIVVGDRVFVTSVEDAQGLNRSLYCFDAKSGTQRWVKTVSCKEEMPTHKTNPYAGTTPACNGNAVVVWHASAGLHAYDVDGNELWSRDLGEFRHMWGYGSSPIIVGDRVVLNSGPGKKVFVAAFDLQSGSTRWMHQEPVEGDGEYNNDRKYMGTWSSPVLIERKGKRLAIVALQKRIVAFDVASGEIQWFFNVTSDRGDLAYSSPIVAGETCLFNAGFKGPSMAFQMTGHGNITDRQIWRTESNPQSIGTGIVIEGFLYRPGAGPNLLECVEIATGETRWKERTGGAFWGSISLAGDVAYVTDQRGSTIVFRPSPQKFDKIAENELGDSCNATPALASGKIFIRTNRKLWCIDAPRDR